MNLDDGSPARSLLTFGGAVDDRASLDFAVQLAELRHLAEAESQVVGGDDLRAHGGIRPAEEEAEKRQAPVMFPMAPRHDQ